MQNGIRKIESRFPYERKIYVSPEAYSDATQAFKRVFCENI